ncbi:MAG: crossover junction endodeoxyribonuclease RuvC [Armatimonadota bacterium]
MMANILTLDVSLTATGWAVVQAGKRVPEQLVDFGVIETEAPPSWMEGAVLLKAKVERVSGVYAELAELVRRYEPVVLCGELPTGSQGYTSAVAMGSVYGVLGALRESLRLPCEWFIFSDIKLAATGRKQASKLAVQEAIAKEWPEVVQEDGQVNEHVCDALGALLALRRTDLYRAILRG